MASLRRNYENISSLRWQLVEIGKCCNVDPLVISRLTDDLKVLMIAIDDKILEINGD